MVYCGQWTVRFGPSHARETLLSQRLLPFRNRLLVVAQLATTIAPFVFCLHACDDRPTSTDYSLISPPSPRPNSSRSSSQTPEAAPPVFGAPARAPVADSQAAASDDTEVSHVGVSFDPPLVDFGRILANSVQSQEVRIINNTDSPITVLEARSTCGCTVARMAERVIRPGDAIATRVQLTAPRRASSVRKQIRFKFADDLPDRQLRVTAEAVQPILVQPEYLTVETISSAVIVIESPDGTAFRLLEVSPPVLATLPGTSVASRHEMRVDELLWNAAGRPPRIEFLIDHPEVSGVVLSVRASAPPQPSSTRSSRSARATLVPPPRLALSADRLDFGAISHDTPSELTLSVMGTFPSDAQPEIVFRSTFAALSLLRVEHHTDGLSLHLRLSAISIEQGFVRSQLEVSLLGSRGWCDVLAEVKTP